MPNYVVMKFGGTSVASKEGRAAVISRVRQHQAAGASPVVVVSALGRRPAPYATDTLLDLIADLPADPRESDKLAAIGEVISAVLVAHELRAATIAAAAFTGAEAGIITDDLASNATILKICPAALIDAAEQGIVPVVSGFQGISETGHTTTLGRGGSDTTACALGLALDADAVEIYSDVDGVMTADPRVVKDAQVIDVIRADELFQLAKMGSRIVYTPAAEIALRSGAALLVKNTFSTHAGTRVADIESARPATAATAIAHTTDIARFVVDLEAEEGECVHIQRQAAVYEHIGAAGISLDMFTPAGDKLYFTVTASEAGQVGQILDGLGAHYQLTCALAKVTVIGAGMHGKPGVMAKIAAALREDNIDIVQIADSHTTISVLVKAEEGTRAVCALHKAFDLEGDCDA